MPVCVGVSAHFMLCMPSPITTSITSARLLKTTTSMVLPLSVLRTVIFSLFMGCRSLLFQQLVQLSAQVLAGLLGRRRARTDICALLHAARHARRHQRAEDARRLRGAVRRVGDRRQVLVRARLVERMVGVGVDIDPDILAGGLERRGEFGAGLG